MTRRIGAAALVLLLAACASAPTGEDLNQSAWAAESRLAAAESMVAPEPPRWQTKSFPGKRATEYRATRKAGRAALHARAESSASALRHDSPIALSAAAQRLQFSWYVDSLLEGADFGRADADDAPVRVMLAFDGDRARFSARDSLLSELSLALTGEPMPYATLMYVWCNRCTPGEVLRHPRTDRIRKIAVEAGPDSLGRWRDYERDVRADFERAFGEPPGALVGVAVMTDADNTRSRTQAWYGPLRFVAADTPRLR